MSTAFATTWEQRLADLGNVPASRIRAEPLPGTATCEDLIRAHREHNRRCELLDGTLVEKAIGWREALLAGVLLHWLWEYLEKNPLGVATGPDAMTRLFADTVRGPDVAFIAWDRLPGGKIPDAAIPDVVPNFVVEILSAGNTYSEMSRKRREYFHAGVQLVWMVDPRDRTVTVYRSSAEFAVVSEGNSIGGEYVLPGWEIDTAKLFSKLDEQPQAGEKR